MRTRILAVTAAIAALAVIFLPLPDAGRVAMKAIPCLCMAWIALEGQGHASLRYGVTFALLCSVIGDVILEVPNRPDLFVPGLVAFLVAHLIYIIVFTSDERELRPALLLSTLVWTGLMWLNMRPLLGDLLVPVTLYVLVITTMIWRALAWGAQGHFAGSMAIVGCILFGISDTFLATNKFVGPLPMPDLLILSTYWLGQAGLTAAVALPPPTKP